jgi:hypothetical protein
MLELALAQGENVTLSDADLAHLQKIRSLASS